VLLAGLGSPLPAAAAGRILFIGQLVKYLPGSVWPVLAQMQLGQAYGVPRHRSATASVLTMLAPLFTGLVTALVTLPFMAGHSPYRWAFAALPVLLICLSPRVLNALLGWLLRLARRPALERPLRGRVLAAPLAWSFLAWLLYGLQVWWLATRLGAPAGTAALLATGGFAFAWCVGFLVVLARPAPASATCCWWRYSAPCWGPARPRGGLDVQDHDDRRRSGRGRGSGFVRSPPAAARKHRRVTGHRPFVKLKNLFIVRLGGSGR
jgi:hypothetical protein